MKIRTSLTLTFFAIVIVILTAVSLAIYFFSADYREQDFYQRLRNKAENTAKLLIEVEEVSPELLKRIERDNPVNLPNERIKIYNFKNEEIYSSDAGDVIHVDQQLLDEIRLSEEVRFRFNEYEVLGFLFAYEFDRFTVVAAATDINGFRKIENLKKILLIVFVISLFLISVSGWIYAGRVIRPITRIVREVDKISASNINLRLAVGDGEDELAKLAETFNQMLNRLEAAFVSQKNFIANASHELRTPITSIAGEIEVTLLHPRTTGEYVKVLHSLLEDARNLGTLSTQLLLLAQTSAQQPPRKLRNVRVDELLWEAKSDVEKGHPEYKISIQYDLKLSDDETLTVTGDEQLIKAVFTNLMDNGCKYSHDNAVKVILRSVNGGDVVIDFENKGIGISKEEITRIFDPFFRGSNTGHIRGYGIGLSLVSHIVKLHQGTISVSSNPGETTRFTLSIPVRGSGN